MNYCCREFGRILEDGRAPLRYDETLRLVSILTLYSAELETEVFEGGEVPACVRDHYLFDGSGFGLRFCPWCGAEFPRSLITEFDSAAESHIREVLNLDPSKMTTPEKESILPDEFRSEAWWKSRGL